MYGVLKVPKIKQDSLNKKDNIMMFLLGSLYISALIIPELINNMATLKAYAIFYYIGLFVLAEVILWKERKNFYRSFNKNVKLYIKFLFVETLLLILIIMNVSFFSVQILGRISQNERTIRKIPDLLQLLLTVIYAPVVEEAVYRYVLRRLIKNEMAFIFFTSIIFGLAHTTSSLNNGFTITEWTVLSTPYVLFGLMMGYVYSRTNSIEINIFNHRILNLIAAVPLIVSVIENYKF